jgi:hypothetical protein
MKCQSCNQEITAEWRKDKRYIKLYPLKFCSRKCSNKQQVQHTLEVRQKISTTLKLKHQQGLIQPPKSKRKLKLTKLVCCNFCEKQFTAKRKFTKNNIAIWPRLCSDQCYINTKRKNARGSKQIIYNGMNFDSLWEVEYVKFLEFHNIPFIIPPPIQWIDSNQKSHKYFPDFYIPILGIYIDPKNPIVIRQQQEKLDIVSKKINLIYGDIQTVKDVTLKKWRAWKELHPHVSH